MTCTDFGFNFHWKLAKVAFRNDILISFCQNKMSEADKSVESVKNAAPASAPAELSINLLSKNRQKRRKKSHFAPISAEQRVEQLKNPDFYDDGEIFFAGFVTNYLIAAEKVPYHAILNPNSILGTRREAKKTRNNTNDAQNNTSSQNWGKTGKLENSFWPREFFLPQQKKPLKVADYPHLRELFLEKYSKWRSHTPKWCFESLFYQNFYRGKRSFEKFCQKFGSPNFYRRNIPQRRTVCLFHNFCS